MIFAFYFQVPKWMPFLPMRAQPLCKGAGFDGMSCMGCSVSLACRQLRFSLLSGQYDKDINCSCKSLLSLSLAPWSILCLMPVS